MNIEVGSRVRIERDETEYPSKGTWPRFRGRTGTVVEINLGEYGVCFSSVTPRTDGRGRFRYDSLDVAWFQPHEIAAIGHSIYGESPQRPLERHDSLTRTDLSTKEFARV